MRGGKTDRCFVNEVRNESLYEIRAFCLCIFIDFLLLLLLLILLLRRIRRRRRKLLGKHTKNLISFTSTPSTGEHNVSLNCSTIFFL